MEEIRGDGGPLLPVQDDLTIEQFILDGQHPTRPRWYGQRPVLIEEATGREIASDELRARTYGLANALSIQWNIGYDDVVCIFSPNHVDYVVAVWAVQKLGGVVSTSNPMYTPEELSYQLQLVKARMLLVHPSVLPVALKSAQAVGIPLDRIVLFEPAVGSLGKFRNIQDLIRFGLGQDQRFTPLRLGPGGATKKLALLLLSSGTTGKPKAVMVSHYSINVNIVQIAQHLRLNDETVPMKHKLYRPGSVSLAIIPFHHAYGMHKLLFGSIFFGSTIVVSPKFNLKRTLQSIQQYQVTHVCVVPPQVLLLCKSPIVTDYDLSSIYFLQCGGAPLSASLQESIVRILPRCTIGQGYGMTETATGVTYCQSDGQLGTPGSVLLPGIVARLVKADGSLAGYHEPGELYLKTPSASLGYLDNPTGTAETFVNGWIRTGDEVVITEQKEVVVVGRIKELIKVRGFQVAPSELEGHLLDHPDVADACVVGIPDEYSVELPFAFVALSPGAQQRIKSKQGETSRTRDTILKHVSDHKAAYKRLAGVHFVDVVPKNASGKLLRRVLRQQAKEMLRCGKLEVVMKSKL